MWHDLQLLGKLLCPISLVEFLVEKLGYRRTKVVVQTFYAGILDHLQRVLPQWTEDEKHAFKLRLDPFTSDGWDTRHSCLEKQ